MADPSFLYELLFSNIALFRLYGSFQQKGMQIMDGVIHHITETQKDHNFFVIFDLEHVENLNSYIHGGFIALADLCLTREGEIAFCNVPSHVIEFWEKE